LIEWCEYHFKIQQSSSDGASVADHLESGIEQLAKVKLARRSKAPPKVAPVEDDVPEFPWPLNYLWQDFLEIADAVERDDYGAPQITWRDIESWSIQMRVVLEPWEARAIVLVSRTGQGVAAKAYSDRMKQVRSNA
jgi:hypothetical protein